jgi:probable F420-dependent oxidoreductase
MKVGTGIGGALDGVQARARRAEAARYDYVSCGELAHDSILTMTLAAAATERVELMTSVTICFPRAPMILAMEAWDIQALSRGRFILGLGSQVKGHNERRFSTPWSAPAPRMKEYIQTLRAIWTTFADPSQRPDFMGAHYQYRLMTPNFNPGPIEVPRPKVFMAVVGPAMARVAGEVADGVLPHGFMTDKYMREVLLPNVAIGLSRAGRSWSDLEISGGGLTVFGEDEADLERQLDALRQPISFYGSTRSYHGVFALHGWADLGERLHALSLRGEWQKMREIIPEEVLRGFAQVSSYEKLPQFMAEHREYASRVSFSMPARTPEERERFQRVLREVQAVQTPRKPRGLAVPPPPR